MSASDKLNHNTLVHLVDAGAVSAAVVIADEDRWTLTVVVGENKKTVIAKNSRSPRVWRKLDTVAKYMKSIGLSTFEIDVTQYDPSKKSLRRPDSASILKKTHEAHRSLQESEADQFIDIDAIATHVKEIKESSPIKVRENWEKRRARILEQENPRVK